MSVPGAAIGSRDGFPETAHAHRLLHVAVHGFCAKRLPPGIVHTAEANRSPVMIEQRTSWRLVVLIWRTSR